MMVSIILGKSTESYVQAGLVQKGAGRSRKWGWGENGVVSREPPESEVKNYVKRPPCWPEFSFQRQTRETN